MAMVGASGENKSSDCRCASCGRDVRRDLDPAFVALRWKRFRGPGGAQKSKLVSFNVVCSELCGRRLGKTGTWGFQRLMHWLGPDAFRQYEDLVSTYWLSRELREVELPNLLHALTETPRTNVVKIRSDFVPFLEEVRVALAQ
jgi:hypothetical protein